MNEDNRVRVIEAFIAAYNCFDLAAMLALVHPDIVFANHSGNEVTAEARGLAQFRELAERSASIFSTRRQTITGVTCAEALVTVAIDYEGTLAVDLPGGPRAGDTLALKGRSEYALKDGKIVGLVDYS
jgi:ketosteroid isomerase-like protein